MSPYAISHNSFAACEELGSVSCRSEKMVFCPRPRRLGLLHADLNDPSLRPLRWLHSSYDTKAGNELSDVILLKGQGGCDSDQSVHHLASSPPFFSGSPPSRVSNPLIQDSRFGAITPRPILTRSDVSSPPPSSRKSVCARSTFGENPAVRIEGFDCLDRDHRKFGIPALA